MHMLLLIASAPLKRRMFLCMLFELGAVFGTVLVVVCVLNQLRWGWMFAEQHQG